VFWWPFLGWPLGEVGVPEASRGLVPVVLLEALGAAALAWCWVQFGLGDPQRRQEFLRTGQLPRDLAA
jgi:hypothetical protein